MLLMLVVAASGCVRCATPTSPVPCCGGVAWVWQCCWSGYEGLALLSLVTLLSQQCQQGTFHLCAALFLPVIHGGFLRAVTQVNCQLRTCSFTFYYFATSCTCETLNNDLNG